MSADDVRVIRKEQENSLNNPIKPNENRNAFPLYKLIYEYREKLDKISDFSEVEKLDLMISYSKLIYDKYLYFCSVPSDTNLTKDDNCLDVYVNNKLIITTYIYSVYNYSSSKDYILTSDFFVILTHLGLFILLESFNEKDSKKYTNLHLFIELIGGTFEYVADEKSIYIQLDF